MAQLYYIPIPIHGRQTATLVTVDPYLNRPSTLHLSIRFTTKMADHFRMQCKHSVIALELDTHSSTVSLVLGLLVAAFIFCTQHGICALGEEDNALEEYDPC